MNAEIRKLAEEELLELINLMTFDNDGDARLVDFVRRNNKSSILPKEHLLGIYQLRLLNARQDSLRIQLEKLVNNMANFEESDVRMSIVGPEHDRVIVFSDREISLLLGLISHADSSLLPSNSQTSQNGIS